VIGWRLGEPQLEEAAQVQRVGRALQVCALRIEALEVPEQQPDVAARRQSPATRRRVERRALGLDEIVEAGSLENLIAERIKGYPWADLASPPTSAAAWRARRLPMAISGSYLSPLSTAEQVSGRPPFTPCIRISGTRLPRWSSGRGMGHPRIPNRAAQAKELEDFRKGRRYVADCLTVRRLPARLSRGPRGRPSTYWSLVVEGPPRCRCGSTPPSRGAPGSSSQYHAESVRHRARPVNAGAAPAPASSPAVTGAAARRKTRCRDRSQMGPLMRLRR
jgi:hypothetical protein